MSRDARLVRDGTQAVAAGTGGASAFTPNPADGPAGSTTLIDRVLQYGFGAQAQAGTPQPAPATTGLGAAGTIALSYPPGATLQSFAANLAGDQAQAAGAAQDALTTGQALQSTLQTKLASETGVSVDTELSNMVVLQNAYGANAKIITAAQSLWTTLLARGDPMITGDYGPLGQAIYASARSRRSWTAHAAGRERPRGRQLCRAGQRGAEHRSTCGRRSGAAGAADRHRRRDRPHERDPDGADADQRHRQPSTRSWPT